MPALDRPSIRDRAARQSRIPGYLESIGRRMVHASFGRIVHGGLRLVDERGEVAFEPPGGQAAATVRVIDPSFYSAVAFGGSMGAAATYIDGAWASDDLAALIETITVNIDAMDALEGPLARALAPVATAAYWLDRNTRAGSKRNIVAHYDLGNEFFRLFLDPTMTYSCAIFENGARTLEEAQIEKIDRSCRKLFLSPSDHLLEIGTGWGALAVHAASRYGCRVTTTTLSEEQHRLAEQRVREAGLEGRVTVLKSDYRDLKGEFDKIVSIEMLEAVGAENLPGYFGACSKLLKPTGAALIQSIVIRDQYFRAAARTQDFIKKYIFPGSCIPSMGAILDAVERKTDMRLWHMEDIGPHYVTTLRMWRETFLAKLDEVRAMGFDDRFIRMWEYYLAYCEGGFRARRIGDAQVLLTKPMCRIPAVGEVVVNK
ncbi:MAG: class I SAM-dependent methyltransferase [Tepidisphaera sp.]